MILAVCFVCDGTLRFDRNRSNRYFARSRRQAHRVDGTQSFLSVEQKNEPS